MNIIINLAFGLSTPTEKVLHEMRAFLALCFMQQYSKAVTKNNGNYNGTKKEARRGQKAARYNNSVPGDTGAVREKYQQFY